MSQQVLFHKLNIIKTDAALNYIRLLFSLWNFILFEQALFFMLRMNVSAAEFSAQL